MDASPLPPAEVASLQSANGAANWTASGDAITEPLVPKRKGRSSTRRHTKRIKVPVVYRGASSAASFVDMPDDGFGPESEDKIVEFRAEGSRILHLAVPLAAQNLFGFALSLIGVAFVGRLGQFDLSVAVLATSIYNVTGVSILVGFAGAMETLCGQAYGGGNYRLVGVVLQRALALNAVLVSIMITCWIWIEDLLLFIGQDPLIAAASARYVHILNPAIVAYAAMECMKRYLMAQGIVRPAMTITVISTCLAPLYFWFFVNYLGLGLDGAAIATDVAYVSMALMLFGYVCYNTYQDRHLHPSENTWHGWSLDAFKSWGYHLQLGVPSVLMVCLEWWTFEAMILMSGMLPNPDLTMSSVGVLFNTAEIFFMCIVGLSGATSTRVANELGANNAIRAKHAAWIAMLIALLFQTFNASVLVAARHVWGLIFTDVRAVVELVGATLPILAATIIGDGVNVTLSGVIRGCGRQSLGATINIVTYWGVGIPLAATLAFKVGLGVKGLYLGLLATTSMQGVVMLLILAFFFDWDKEARRAVALVGASNAALGSV